VLLWGLGLGVQESVMAAAVATMIPAHGRAGAYGVFSAVFGVAWFLGSVLQGALYDISIPAMVAISLTAQAASLPFILTAARRVSAR
jgi:predicted MFS family arabinose efflux permease